jgi:hypothetical protein
MTDLEQLALRCEGASGPDRELDALIFASTLDLTNTRIASIEDWAAEAVRGKWNWPRYTASIDAAMTLVPEGWVTFLASEDRHSRRWKWHLRCAGVNAEARSVPPALALTAAALRARARARQTRQPQEGGGDDA